MIDDLLSKLERVRQTGPQNWIASCPTREDRRPSLTIRLMDDGRILLHDFGGASTEEILGTLGLDWSALFPEDTTHQARPERRAFPAIDVLRCVAFEALVVQCAAASIRTGEPLSRADHERLGVAVERLQEAVRRAEA